MKEHGNDQDWQGWFDDHAAALVLYARRFVPRLADAEDVVQEGFVRFWRSREQAHDSTAYLYACVKNCAIDWLRHQDRRSRSLQSEAGPDLAHEPSISGGLEREERRVAIETALERLPCEQAEVLVMKIWCELTFAQIAQALDITPNTAASRYRYALERLRKELVGATV